MLSVLATPAVVLLSLVLSATGGPDMVGSARAARPAPSGSRGAPRAAWVPEVPASLVSVLSIPPNVEGRCRSVSVPRFPHPAEECSYEAAGRSWTLTTATPPSERVARWIVDASSFLPAVKGLRARDHAAWEDALVIIARQMLSQSGRVFPIDGVVWESFEGPTGYVFHDGVTYGTFGGPLETCRACACRIDSLTRSEWCTYSAEVLGGETKAACLEALGGDAGWNDAWSTRCLETHADAFTSDHNEGFRAVAYYVQKHQLGPLFPNPDEAEPSTVVAELERAYAHPLSISSVARPRPVTE